MHGDKHRAAAPQEAESDAAAAAAIQPRGSITAGAVFSCLYWP
jgi:hypothetical protein